MGRLTSIISIFKAMMLKVTNAGLLLTALGHARAEVMSPVASQHDRFAVDQCPLRI
jgi:hypothetical protein